jgi:hypothetical protein
MTPLGIIAAFVTLTETVLGFVATQVTGGIQIAVTAFVITFATLVAAAFFLILWKRPWVFYSPSEYGQMDPEKFMKAQSNAPLMKEQVALVKSVEQNPADLDSKFSLIDLMADEPQTQLVIFMHEKQKEAPRHLQYIYEFSAGTAGAGAYDFLGRNKLEGAGLVKQVASGNSYALTDDGKRFAEWLIKKGRKCSFFWTPLGSWGSPKQGGSGEKWLRERQ